MNPGTRVTVKAGFNFEKHRESPKLPWHNKIKLLFWSSFFVVDIFVLLSQILKCQSVSRSVTTTRVGIELTGQLCKEDEDNDNHDGVGDNDNGT